MPINEDLDLRKALITTSGTGSNLIPEIVSEGLRKFVITASPLYAEVPKQPWENNTYVYRSITGLPTASFEADGATLPSATTGTYAKPTVAMKYIYTRGEVTGPMQQAAGNLLDALQLEVELHADGLVRTIEQKILTGDTGSDADEFDGLIEQIDTNKHDASSTSLSLSHLDTALDKPFGYPTHIILNRAMKRKLQSLLQAHQRYIDRTEVAGGFRVPTYNDLPIIAVDNSITGLTTTVVLPDFRLVKFLIGQDIMFEPLAKTKDSDDFMLKMYCTLAVEGEALYHGKIINVTST